MNDNFASIWQEQTTAGVKVSVDEIKQRAQRLKASMARRRAIGISCSVLIVVSSSGSLLFFDTIAAGWFRAAQFILWLLVIVFGPPAFRAAAQGPGRVLSLNMLAAPCSVRRVLPAGTGASPQVPAHRARIALVMIPFGIPFVWLSTIRPKNAYPILLTGLTATVIGLVWYLQIRRETPKIQAEFDQLNQDSGNLK